MQSETQWVMVPKEPTDELLRSMAIRYDHGLGVPGYYDQPIFGAENVGHARRLESAMTTMRQLHEEVVGTGFYRAPSPPAGSGEPVAWAYAWRHVGEKGWHFAGARPFNPGIEIQPLYLAPDAAQQRIAALEEALRKIASPTSPERLSGAHLTPEGRRELAFAMIDNFQSIARKALGGSHE